MKALSATAEVSAGETEETGLVVILSTASHSERSEESL